MIKIDEDILISDLVSTAYSFSTANRDFIKKEYNNFLVLNQSLALNHGKIIKGQDTLLDRSKYPDDYYNYGDNSYNEFIDKIDEIQYLLKDIAGHYKRFLKKIRFGQMSHFDKMKSFSEKDFIDIIISYYASYGDKYYKIAKKYFEEKRINIDSTLLEEAGGYFVPIIWLNSGYIYSLYPNYDTISAASIVHELGHAVDAEIFLFPQQKKLPIFSDLLLEVPSTTFEMGFYDYLRKQYIDIDGGLILDNNRVADVYDFFANLRDAINSENLDVDIDGIATNEKGYEYDFRTDIVYGLGYYLAFHLNEIRNSGNKDYLKILNSIITLRKEASLYDIVNMLGIRLEDFVYGTHIKPRIKENLLTLKKRYNVY